VALLRDVVEFEQPVEPDRPHHVGNPRDVNEEAFQAALEERPAPHNLRVGIKEGSRSVGEIGPQFLVDLEPIPRGPHPQKSQVGLVGQRAHGRDLEFEQMVLRGVHVDRHDLLRAIVKQVEHTSAPGGDAKYAFAGAQVQCLELTARVLVARRVADALAELPPGNRIRLSLGRVVSGGASCRAGADFLARSRCMGFVPLWCKPGHGFLFSDCTCMPNFCIRRKS